MGVAETALAESDRKTFLFLGNEWPTFAVGIMGAPTTRLRDDDERFGARVTGHSG